MSLVDLPAPQLSPVILWCRRRHDSRWKARRRCTIQYLYRRLRGLHSIFCARIEPATDNSEAHLAGKNAVDRCVCDGVQTLQRFICILGHTRRISQEQDEKNEGVRR